MNRSFSQIAYPISALVVFLCTSFPVATAMAGYPALDEVLVCHGSDKNEPAQFEDFFVGVLSEQPLQSCLFSWEKNASVVEGDCWFMAANAKYKAIVVPTADITIDVPTSEISVDVPDSGIAIDVPGSAISVDVPDTGIRVTVPSKDWKNVDLSCWTADVALDLDCQTSPAGSILPGADPDDTIVCFDVKTLSRL